MRTSELVPRNARLRLPKPRTRAQRIRDEVRGEFARLGMVDATDVITRPAEVWELKGEGR